MVTPVRRNMQENVPVFFPFRQFRATNVLSNFYRDPDSGSDLNVTKVLFLGCGDIMKTLEASTTKHIKNLHVHLNDNNSSILARNILILKVISDEKFDPDKEDDLAFLWDLWYNLEWPAKTDTKFTKVLKELLDGLLPENVSIPNVSHVESLMKVWRGWLALSTKMHSQSFIESIKKERLLLIGDFKTNTISAEAREKAKQNNVDSFSKALDKMVSQLELLILFNNSNVSEDDVRKKICEEIRQYFQRGSCRLENKQSVVCVNPTLLNSLTLDWQLYPDLCPFNGYLPMSDEELSLESAKNPILVHACQKILKGLVSSYRSRLNSIRVSFHLGGALDFCYAETNNKFDVVDSSNLADCFGLPNLIIAAMEVLADHSEAVLWTEAEIWTEFGFSMEKFIEDVLCCPISMIPTIYGVRLGNHVALGSSSLQLLEKSRSIFWKRAQRVKNLVFHQSAVLSRCLDQLAEKCFVWKFPPLPSINLNKHLFSLMSYTPLTFYYIIGSMTQRLGGDHWLKDVPHFTNIPPALKLAKRTLDAWKSGQPILKMTAHFKYDLKSEDIHIFNKGSRPGAPSVRLILYPKSKYKDRAVKLLPRMREMGLANTYLETFRDMLSLPDVHIIDNFKFERKITTEEDSATVSFLLVPDHGLGKTHQALLVDIVNDIPSFIFHDVVDSMQKENFSLSFPSFDSFKASTPAAGFKENRIKVDSCIETEDKYFLKLSVSSKDDMSGLKIFASNSSPYPRQFDSPLVICNTLHVSTCMSCDCNPLFIVFPHPFLFEDLTLIAGHGDRVCKISLKKGLLHPWPSEIMTIDRSRWITNSLKKWADYSEGSHSLLAHLNGQFLLGELALPITPIAKSPLNSIRESIKKLFLEPNYFGLLINGMPADLFCIKIHQPIVVSPIGGPMLVVTVNDSRMESYLEKEKKLEKKNDDEFARKILHDGRRNGEILMEVNATPEEILLWRYIFHVNSTKMVPTLWQKEKIQIGPNSPWTATFISPLYLDFPFEKVLNGKVDSLSVTKPEEEKVRCTSCKKIPKDLKRCGRCRVVFYCSVECQRGHWVHHKSTCAKK